MVSLYGDLLIIRTSFIASIGRFVF